MSDSKPNIFHRLVTKEDDYTQLLCNLILRFSDFRRKTLALLFSEEIANQFSEGQLNIDTQVNLPDHGRPDAAIRATDLLALLEVKVHANCGPGPNQNIDVEEPRGYAAYLMGRSEPNCWLVYLVPEDWKSIKILEEHLDAPRRSYPRIRTNIILWEQLIPIVGDSNPSTLNLLLEEFHTLLLKRFHPLSFLKEEVSMLKSCDFSRSFQAMQKLQLLIDKVARQGAKRFNLDVEFDLEAEDEYGFYFKDGKDYLLWFGMWSAPCEAFQAEYGGTPPKLWLGVEHKWDSAVINTFREAYEEKSQIEIGDTWTVSWISNGFMEGGNAVDVVWKQLDPLMEQLLARVNRDM